MSEARDYVAQEIRELSIRFSHAIGTADRALAKACITPAGAMPGETPAVLFLDALERGYGLAVADEEARWEETSGRGYARAEVVKEGYPGRSVWLLAEREGGRLGLSGVTGSPRVAEAFIEGIVPADARLGALPESERAAALGARLVAAHERHGRVGEVLGAWPVAAMAAGAMLDSMLGTPGATLSVVDARELLDGSRAALGLEVQRPDRIMGEALWLVLALGAEPVVLTTASSMSLELLVTTAVARGARPDDSIFERDGRPLRAAEATGAVPRPMVASAAPAGEVGGPGRGERGDGEPGGDPLDRIDMLLAALRAKVEPDPVANTATAGDGELEGNRPGGLRSGLLDAESRARLSADPEGAELIQKLLERLVEAVPSGDLGALRARLPELFEELAAALQRSLRDGAQ